MVFTFDKGPRADEPPNYKPSVARYRVVLTVDGEQIISGSCHMVEKIYIRSKLASAISRLAGEGAPYKWRGIFYNCQLLGHGPSKRLQGYFLNTLNSNVKHHAAFTFHMPRRWGEIDAIEMDK
jgi:hypothetical protein